MSAVINAVIVSFTGLMCGFACVTIKGRFGVLSTSCWAGVTVAVIWGHFGMPILSAYSHSPPQKMANKTTEMAK